MDLIILTKRDDADVFQNVSNIYESISYNSVVSTLKCVLL